MSNFFRYLRMTNSKSSKQLKIQEKSAVNENTNFHTPISPKDAVDADPTRRIGLNARKSSSVLPKSDACCTV